MAQKPMMGAPIQPAAPSSPSALNFQSDPANRASFKGFMTSLNALPNISVPPPAPMPAPMVPAAEVDIFQPNAYADGGAVGALRNLHQASGQMARQLSQLAGVGGNGQSQGSLGGFSGFNNIFNLPTFSTPTAPGNLPSIPPPLSPVPTAAVSNETPVTSIGQSQNTGGLFGRAIIEPAPTPVPVQTPTPPRTIMTNDIMSRTSYPTDEAYNNAMSFVNRDMGPSEGITPRPEIPSPPPSLGMDSNSVVGSSGSARDYSNSSMDNLMSLGNLFSGLAMPSMSVFNYEDGGAVPMRTEIAGQPHMLSYITPGEASVLKAMGGAGAPGPGGIPSYYYDDIGMGGIGTGGSSNFSGSSGGYSYSDDSPSTGGYDPVGTGVVDDPGWSSGTYSNDDDSSNYFGTTPTPPPVYYDSFGNTYNTQAKATAADQAAAQRAAEAAAAEAARVEAARIEQENQAQAVDIALNQAASRRQQQIDDALQASTIPGGERPQVSLTASTPQQSTVYSQDMLDADPFALPGSAPAFAESIIKSPTATTGYDDAPLSELNKLNDALNLMGLDADLLNIDASSSDINRRTMDNIASMQGNRGEQVYVAEDMMIPGMGNASVTSITPIQTPLEVVANDANMRNIDPGMSMAMDAGEFAPNKFSGDALSNLLNDPYEQETVDALGRTVDIGLPAPRPDSVLSTPVPFGDDDEYTSMGATVPFGTIPPDERDEEVVSALNDDFLDKEGRDDLNVLAGEAIDYFNNPLTKGLDFIDDFLPFNLTTTAAGLPKGRIGDMQLGVQQGGRLVQDDSGSPLYVQMPDGSRVGETPEFVSTDDDTPMLAGPPSAGGPSTAAEEVEEIIRGLGGITQPTPEEPVFSIPTLPQISPPAQGGMSLGFGYGGMKQAPSNLDSAMENFFRMLGGYAEGGEVKNFARGGYADTSSLEGLMEASGYGTSAGQAISDAMADRNEPDDGPPMDNNVQTVIAQPVQNEVVVANPTPKNMQTASEILQKNEALAAKGMQTGNPITRMISSLIAPSPETQAIAASMNKLSSKAPNLLNSDAPVGGQLTSVPVAAQYADYKPTAAGIEQGIQGLSQVGRERPSSGFSIPKIDLGAIAERIMGSKPTYDNLSKFTSGVGADGKAAPFTVRPEIRPGYMGVRANIPF